MIEVHDLSKRFPHKKALDSITFDIPRGVICGLVGPNGAGKTTLLRILATLLRPDEGSAMVAGFEIEVEAQEVRARIGYMPDVFEAEEDVRVESYLQFFAHVSGLEAKESWGIGMGMTRFAAAFRRLAARGD